MLTCLDIDIATLTPLNAFLEKGPNFLAVMLPTFTASEANGGVKKAIKLISGKIRYKAEHWRDKHRRHKSQKAIVNFTLRPHRSMLKLPCKIILTRYAPRKLDQFDNLPMSLKYILDGICEVITGDYVPGRADSHEGLEVKYQQIVNKQYGVLIQIIMT